MTGPTPSRLTRTLRIILRVIGVILLRLLTRTRITGREHITTPGPVIYAANHASTFDALLLLTLLPPDVVFVGPGDFELLWPANWVIRFMGVILMKRGSVDREGLKHMLSTLKQGGRLALFPEGGTWEKPVHDVKSGVSYISHATGAKIVPMGYGGTYQVWVKMLTLRFPRITVTIGPPLDPVTVSDNRKTRQDELQAAALDLMHTIYDLLPQADRDRFDQLARERFSGSLVFDPPRDSVPDADFGALAELITKPNLFSPLHRNARLPVKPFLRPGKFVSPEELRRAARALQDAFAEGDYAGYLEYRLGDGKAAEVRESLAAILAALDPGNPANAGGARVTFVPVVTEISEN